MKLSWILSLGWMLCMPWALSAQTALSVEDNALWRVDLHSQDVEWVADLGAADPDFDCWDLAVSPTGIIRCVANDQLYSIEPGATFALAALPAGSPSALAFDSQGTLWFAGGDPLSLWQLEPATGAIIGTVPLSVEGENLLALAVRGDRLFGFTRQSGFQPKLEEIDPTTGASLSSFDLEPFGIYSPIDAAFDAEGKLWVTNFIGGIILGFVIIEYFQLDLEPFSAEMTFSGGFFIGDPVYTNIDAVEISGSLVEVPALGPVGLALLSLLLVVAAWFVLRRGSI